MAAGEDWSAQEVKAAVVDYMAMLRFELAGQPYNKAAHRRALLARLAGRSDGAVELKHQNTSAVLRDLGYFWIPGYKPRSNYQSILAHEVAAWVRANPDIDQHATAAAEAPAAVPEHPDFTTFAVTRPSMHEKRETGVQEMASGYGGGNAPRVARMRDYAAREAYNSSLGRAGEELVMKFEQYRLAQAGVPHLAEKVEHISKTQGDGLGFDILSFEADGSERFIEVKTTRFAKETPFFASAGEIRFARQNARCFALYRLFEFRSNPKCYTLPGVIEDHCALDPVSFRCSFV